MKVGALAGSSNSSLEVCVCYLKNYHMGVFLHASCTGPSPEWRDAVLHGARLLRLLLASSMLRAQALTLSWRDAVLHGARLLLAASSMLPAQALTLSWRDAALLGAFPSKLEEARDFHFRVQELL